MPSIAIIGASADRAKFGNKAVRAYAQLGYTVYPVHPKAESIEGHKVYKSISEIPVSSLDRVSLYVPPSVGLGLIDEIAEKRVSEVWLNPGAESEELILKGEKLGLNMISACSLAAIGIKPENF